MRKILTVCGFICIGFGILFIWHNQVSFFTYFPEQQQLVDTLVAQNGMEKAIVTKVVDGDTIDVTVQNKQKTVRLIGINTPETVDPKKPVQCFGPEASNETKQLLSGKIIAMAKDTSDTDKYGRLLRFIYVPASNTQMLFVNDYLVREGYAYVETIPPDTSLSSQFISAQSSAKNSQKGLWMKCQKN